MSFDYDQLSPGIRGAVQWLHHWCYETSDSGDGSNAQAGMEGACEEPMVAVIPSSLDEMHYEARMLLHDLRKSFVRQFVREIQVQATYDPRDESAVILLTGKGLLSLRPPEHSWTLR